MGWGLHLQTSGCSQHSLSVFALAACVSPPFAAPRLVFLSLLLSTHRLPLCLRGLPSAFRVLPAPPPPLFGFLNGCLKQNKNNKNRNLKTKATVQTSVILSSLTAQVLRSRLNARAAVQSREVCLLFVNCLRCFLVVCDASRTLWFGFFPQLHFQSGSNHYSAYKTIEHQIAIQVGGARDSEA